MVIVLIASAALGVFLLGVLVIACSVTTRHGDPSACYKLHAVRDGLVDAVVFRGVPRNDPWLDSIYENVNNILVHSNLVAGPDGWPLAVAVGHYQAAYPNLRGALRPLPGSPSRECPAPVRALGSELRTALEHLVNHHFGIHLQMDARARERRRLQREKAKDLLEMINEGRACG